MTGQLPFPIGSRVSEERAAAGGYLTKLRRQMGIGSRALFGLWLLLMVLTPHALRLGGQATLLLTLNLSIIVQIGLVLSLLSAAWTARTVIKSTLIVLVLAWSSEFVGVRTGLPFGHYHYTNALQPQVGQVPLQVPAAWLMMMPPAWAVGALICGRRRKPVRRGGHRLANATMALASGLAMTAWDLFLDPQMVSWQLWQWEPAGGYFGIPWINFAGWTLTAAGITFAVFAPSKAGALPLESLLLVYTTAWLLESVGLGLFFQLPGPAIGGFVGMGLFAALAWRSMLAGER